MISLLLLVGADSDSGCPSLLDATHAASFPYSYVNGTDRVHEQ
jgi:hypothetical protein